MPFRRFTPILTFLALACASASSVAQQSPLHPSHPIKCATPQAEEPQAGIYPLTFALPPAFPDSVVSPSGRFVIYYYAPGDTTDTSWIATTAFADSAALDADRAYDFEIGTLGYTAPQFTVVYFNPATNDSVRHYNIYLIAFHTPQGFSGLEAYGATFILDGGQLGDSPSGNYRFRSYIQTDNSFNSDIYATHGTDALRITIFHEFFHVIQFSGYGHPPNFQDPYPNYVFFQEMSSVWMEWLSTPRVKDYLNYVAQYLNTLDDRFDKSPSGGYGQYIFFAYLTHRFSDTGIVKKIWEYYRDSSGDPITCIDQVLREYGSSFCQEYQNFGAELMQTGRRYGGESLLPDAQVLPLDTIPTSRVALASPLSFVSLPLSLQFAAAGDGPDTCIEIMARDTNRSLESNGSVEFTSLDTPPMLALDTPSAYCDSEICLMPLYATSPDLQVYPNPFISTGSSVAYLLASTNPLPPISVVMNIMGLDMNEIRSTKLPAAPFKGSWNAVWDGRDDNGNLVASGEYLYTLHVDGALKVGKIVVVRE